MDTKPHIRKRGGEWHARWRWGADQTILSAGSLEELGEMIVHFKYIQDGIDGVGERAEGRSEFFTPTRMLCGAIMVAAFIILGLLPPR